MIIYKSIRIFGKFADLSPGKFSAVFIVHEWTNYHNNHRKNSSKICENLSIQVRNKQEKSHENFISILVDKICCCNRKKKIKKNVRDNVEKRPFMSFHQHIESGGKFFSFPLGFSIVFVHTHTTMHGNDQ